MSSTAGSGLAPVHGQRQEHREAPGDPLLPTMAIEIAPQRRSPPGSCERASGDVVPSATLKEHNESPKSGHKNRAVGPDRILVVDDQRQPACHGDSGIDRVPKGGTRMLWLIIGAVLAVMLVAAYFTDRESRRIRGHAGRVAGGAVSRRLDAVAEGNLYQFDAGPLMHSHLNQHYHGSTHLGQHHHG
jgi:hypothetical protein